MAQAKARGTSQGETDDEVVAILRRLEPTLDQVVKTQEDQGQRLASIEGELKQHGERLAALEGRVSQLPTLWQTAGILFGLLAAAAALAALFVGLAG